MRDFSGQAVLALSVYLERGKAALERLRADQYDEAVEILRWRNAAFQNFRVVDEMAKKQGIDVGQDERILEIWKKLPAIDEALKAELGAAYDKTSNLFSKVRNVRNKISNYRSGNRNQHRLVKSI